MIKYKRSKLETEERRMPEIGMLLREGKGKKVYATDDPDKAIVFFKDEAMAFHGLKRGRILGKGEVNNAICEHLFSLLAANGIESHFIEKIDARHSLVKRCDMLPFTVRIRNRVAGQLAERTRLPVGQKLDPPVVEYVMRDTDMEVDPMINHTHIYAMKVATPEEMAQIDIDFKLQFGRYHGRIIVGDEITPDTARFWDSSTHEPLDKDRFRRDMDNVAEAYQEVLHRMMGAS